MLDFKIKTSKLKIDILPPDKQFWQAIALDSAATIRERTEDGKSVDGNGFRRYSKAYAEKRRKTGRSTTPNLTWSGRMLGNIKSIARKAGARISIIGEEGFKAWANEEAGRPWFDLSRKQRDIILKRVDAWMKRKNNLS